MWPRFEFLNHMWVEFAVGSRPCSEGFSPGSPVFLPPQKPTFPNSNSTWKQWMKSHSMDMPRQILIYLFYFILVDFVSFSASRRQTLASGKECLQNILCGKPLKQYLFPYKSSLSDYDTIEDTRELPFVYTL